MSISAELRNSIEKLAGNCCEYCRVAQEDRGSKFQIDHIIPVKHGGKDVKENLSLACLKCNSYKGPNAAAIDPDSGDATKLYNPRMQKWNEHFEIQDDARLLGKTPEGRVTILVLRINDISRVKQRKMSMDSGEYPCQIKDNQS